MGEVRLQKGVTDLFPVIDPFEMVQVDVVRGSKNEFFTIESLKVVNEVIDHKIAVNDRLVSAEHELSPREEGKMFPDPFKLLREGLWKLHSRRYDEYLIFLVQLFHYGLAIFIYRHGPEKVVAVWEFGNGAVIFRKALTFALAIQDRAVDSNAEFLFVVVDKLPGRIGHHIIHINDQSFHSLGFGIFLLANLLFCIV